MIIVAGTITIDPQEFDAYQAIARPMVEATLTEDGCHAYNFAQSVVDPSTIIIYEAWESMAHLEAHFVVPHMATFKAAMATLTVSGRDLKAYEADAVRTL
jgi:quinol monooxygenase YgiN